MLKKKKRATPDGFKKKLSLSLLLISVSSILQWSSLPLNITGLWWGINAFVLFLFWKGKNLAYNLQNEKYIRFVKWYLIWNIICIIRGLFVADIYWEWKNLISTAMILLLPLSVQMATNKLVVQYIFRTWIKIALPVFFLLALSFTYSDAVGRYLAPISFILLFFPVLPKKGKIITLIFAGIVFWADLNARSNIIKFAVPLLLSAIFFVRYYVGVKIFEFARLLFMILPFIFFTLAVMGKFNVFKMDEYIAGKYEMQIVEKGEKSTANLIADTRTVLYQEVLLSAFKYDYWILGRTPAKGNESEWFGWGMKEDLGLSTNERFSNEVSILNIFTWTGVVGVALYFLVFFYSSYLAINRSKSFFARIVGLYVAFRWTYAWVEDFSRFDLSYLILWLAIGLCLSQSFRNLNDLQIKLWIRGIFEHKYRLKLSGYSRWRENQKTSKTNYTPEIYP